MSKEQDKKAKQILERVERERGFARVWPKLLAARDPEYAECFHT